MRAGTGCFLLILSCSAIALAQQEEELPDELEPEARPEPEPEPEPEPPAPVDTWQWPGTVLVELSPRVHLPAFSDFDRALISHAYGHTGVVTQMMFGVSTPAGIEWLWLGGRIGMRGRTWDHAYHSGASLMGVDVLATVRARANLGSVELGLVVAGGIAWMGLWVNGAMSDTFAPRFDVGAELAFRIGRHFAIGPRAGWDYLEWIAINEYGHGVDAGGFYFGVGIEGRE